MITCSHKHSALRMTYLQNGGNDQMILAHLQDLLTEAQLIEQKEKHAQSMRKKNKRRLHSFSITKSKNKKYIVKKFTLSFAQCTLYEYKTYTMD